MKKLLVLSLVVLFALSGAAFASLGHMGHVRPGDPEVSARPVQAQTITPADETFLAGQGFPGLSRFEDVNPPLTDEIRSELMSEFAGDAVNVNVAALPLLSTPIIGNVNFVIKFSFSEIASALGTSNDADWTFAYLKSIHTKRGERYNLIREGNDLFVVLLGAHSGIEYDRNPNPGILEAQLFFANVTEQLPPYDSGCNAAGLPLLAGILLFGLLLVKRK